MPHFLTTTVGDLDGLELEHAFVNRCPINAMSAHGCANACDTRAEADAIRLTLPDPAAYTVRLYVTYTERRRWYDRERGRLEDGTYKPIDAFHALPAIPDHYPHWSTKTPGHISFTPDDTWGYEDRQLSMRLGRYLAKYYPHLPEADRATLAASADSFRFTLHLATTPDDIERVYRGKGYQSVPFQSCMGPDKHEEWGNPHPVRAYGDSDLAVAYIGPIDACLARAIVWPDKQIHTCKDGRYGDTARLLPLLAAAGYTYGHLWGARLRARRHPNGGYVMPYVDRHEKAEFLSPHWLRLERDGNINTQVTDGYSIPTETYTCEHCSCTVEDDDGDGSLCNDCVSRQWSCAKCDDVSYDEVVYHDRDWQPLCPDCAAPSEQTCPECSDTWNERRYSPRVQRNRLAAHQTEICANCAPSVTVCHVCAGEPTALRQTYASHLPTCPHCGVSPRCPGTQGLDFAPPAAPDDFPVGTIVCLTSDVYGDYPSNPRWGGQRGYVTGVIEPTVAVYLSVTWANGTRNTYDRTDLTRRDRLPDPPTTLPQSEPLESQHVA